MNRWRRLLLGTIPLILAATMAVGIQADGADDPRNTSDEYFDAVNNAQCMEHHVEDGFVPFGFGFVDTYTQLPIGEPIDIQVRLDHTTQYAPHQVESISVIVDNKEAPNIDIQGEIGEDHQESWSQELEDDEAFQAAFEVYDGAHAGEVSARVVKTDPPLDLVDPGELTVQVEGRSATGDGEATLRLGHEHFFDHGPGEQDLEVVWRAPGPGVAGFVPLMTATLEIDLEIEYDLNITRFTFTTDDILRSKDDHVVVSIPVVIESHEQALLDFEIRGNTYWEHVPGDGASQNSGTFYRFITLEVTGGDEAVVGGPVAPQELAQTPLVALLGAGLLGWVVCRRRSRT